MFQTKLVLTINSYKFQKINSSSSSFRENKFFDIFISISLLQGWGITSHTANTRTSTLQQTVLPVVQSPHKGCHGSREVVCVGNGFGTRPDGSQHANACRGDSGGPLVCEKNGRWSVEGVASYVHTYCKYYTAYAPVNKYLDWMKLYVPTL